MTRQQRTTVAVASVVLTAFTLGMDGCDANPNQAACTRILTYVFGCGAPFFGVEVSQEVFEVIPEACATVPETSECDWSELEDCVNSFSCAQWLDGSGAPRVCLAIEAELLSAGCGPIPDGP